MPIDLTDDERAVYLAAFGASVVKQGSRLLGSARDAAKWAEVAVDQFRLMQSEAASEQRLGFPKAG